MSEDQRSRWLEKNLADLPTWTARQVIGVAWKYAEVDADGGLNPSGEALALILAAAEDAGRLTDRVAQAAVFAWSYCVHPHDILPNERWRGLFRRAGYIENCDPADVPAGPLRLYRGHLEQYRANWSWTGDLDAAREWANNVDPSAKVWTVQAACTDLFGHFTERREDEYILDPAHLRIELVE